MSGAATAVSALIRNTSSKMSSNRVPAQLSGDEAAAAEEILEKLQSSESRSGFLFVNRVQKGAAFEAVLRRHETLENFGKFPSAVCSADAH